jgi:hypothetical protein
VAAIALASLLYSLFSPAFVSLTLFALQVCAPARSLLVLTSSLLLLSALLLAAPFIPSS